MEREVLETLYHSLKAAYWHGEIEYTEYLKAVRAVEKELGL